MAASKERLKSGELDAKVDAKRAERDQAVARIGNLVPEETPTADRVVATWGQLGGLSGEAGPLPRPAMEILSEAGLTDEAKGVEVSGHGARCPPLALAKPEIQTAKPIRYLRGDGVLLAQAVRQLGLAHLVAQGYCPLQAPCFLQPRALEARVWTHPPGRRMTPNA